MSLFPFLKFRALNLALEFLSRSAHHALLAELTIIGPKLTNGYLAEIGILLYPGVASATVHGLTDMFTVASSVAREHIGVNSTKSSTISTTISMKGSKTRIEDGSGCHPISQEQVGVGAGHALRRATRSSGAGLDNRMVQRLLSGRFLHGRTARPLVGQAGRPLR